MPAGGTHGLADDPRSRVSAVAARHEKTLLHVARQFSLCHDDALDAYQRALEIFVRRVETVDPQTEVAWLKVVVRHEAMAIRRARSESVTNEEVDLDAFVPGPDRAIEEQVVSGERVRQSAEALRALKPDEAQALMMRAHGLSYQEIGDRNGWSFTKVNRAVTEGRRRFMRAYAGIEAGDECERFGPTVEALARGEATSRQVLEIRPHLRHCTACRATVRDLHLSKLRRASLLWPAIGVTADRDIPSLETVLEIERPAPDPGWLTSIKHELTGIVHRLNASDAATGIHLATSSGGGRISALAAVVALCLSSLTAGTVCVVTGVIPDPLERLQADSPRLVERKPVRQRAPRASARDVVERIEATALPQPPPRPVTTPEPQAERQPAPREERRQASRDPAQGTGPADHENAPISPAPATAAVSAETFTPESPSSPPQPAAAPATGGGEFNP